MASGAPTTSGQTSSSNISAKTKAAASGTNRGTVEKGAELWRVWYSVKTMADTVIPDSPGAGAGIMDWSRYLSDLEKLPQDDESVQIAIQGARDMIAELEWVEPEGPEEPG